MSIVTKEWAKKLEEAEYLDDVLNGLEEIQKENGYTDEEMDNDLDVALWRAYVYNNMDSYEYYELSEKTLAKVKDKGIKNGVWCYRYSCALVYLRRFDEALEYSRLGTKVEPSYPWGWLQLGRLCYKYNLLEEAYGAIDKGLELVPNDYEFLTLKDDIENDRGYAYANSHYIDEETDKNYEKRLINIDDEELYNSFINKSELEKKLEILHKENKNKEIIEIINSLPKDELNYDILGKLARAYNNNEEYDKGLEVLFKIKDEGENTSLWNFRVGYSYYYSGKLEEAQKYFERCLELNPNEPDGDTLLRYTYSDLGTKKLEEGKNEEALEYFKKIRNLAKNNDDIIFAESELAWAYDHMGEYEKSYEYLKNVMALGRDDIWLHSELGFCLGGMKKTEEGIEEYKKAIELGRNDSWIFNRIGSLYEELGKYDEALENYFKVLEENPDDIWTNSEIGWIYNNIKNDFSKGLEYLEKARKLGRDDVWLNSELAWAYDHMGEYEKGLNHILRAKELGRDDDWLNYEIGFSLSRQNKIEEALKYYFKAKELGKDDGWVNSEIGYCFDSLEKYEEALPYLQKAKEKRDDIWINSELGFCLNRLGRYEEALTYFEKAIELGRDDEWAYSETGFSLKKMDRYEEALNYYLKSEETGRNDDWLNVEIAECLGEVGKIEEAITRLKKTLTLKDCEKDLINSQIGYLYGKNNNSKEALNYLYEAQKLGRDDIWLNSEIGWDLVNVADDSSQKLEDSSKTYEEALKYLNKAVELGRDDEWIHGQLGYTLSKMGRYKDAILHFEKVRFIDPNDMWILYHLGIALRKSGEIQKAIEILESSLEKTKYRGWVELELAWCYALIEDREKAQKYLDEAESYIGGEKENSLEVKKDFEMVKQLLQPLNYLS